MITVTTATSTTDNIKMSTSKRIPKRSIIGCRVCVESEDGVWRPATVMGMRPGQVFSVKMDHSGQVCEHSETRILGPGFLSSLPPGARLSQGQHVFLTHNGREVEGRVVQHSRDQDCVRVDIGDEAVISKRLDDIRLMESRKSARLVNSDTDFSLLADFNIVEQRKLAQESQAVQVSAPPPVSYSRRRLHSMSDFHDRKRQKNLDAARREAKRRQRSERQAGVGALRQQQAASSNIDVPGPGLSSSGSRKRRTSESRAELDSGYGSSFGSGFFKTGEETVRECTAAMVLMNLSVSPRDKWLDPASYLDCSASSDCPSSPPPTTPRPSPAPSLSQIHLSEDEEPYKRWRPAPAPPTQYQCTWRGCGLVDTCQDAMERHVRGHLGLPDPPPGTDYGGEEDFYYTELEPDTELGMEMEPASDSGCSSSSNDGMNFCYKLSSAPSPPVVRIMPSPASPSSSLASSVPSNFGSTHPLGDHIGMARPSSEAPPAPATIYVVNTLHTPAKQTNSDHLYNSSNWQGKKLVSIVPRPESSPGAKSESGDSPPFVFKSQAGTAGKSDKKCRKVYGIDQRDLWCTQCKWKKACGRFT